MSRRQPLTDNESHRQHAELVARLRNACSCEPELQHQCDDCKAADAIEALEQREAWWKEMDAIRQRSERGVPGWPDGWIEADAKRAAELRRLLNVEGE